MSVDTSRFKQGANLYLNRFTIGLVYEGVKEILYNDTHLRLNPGEVFCLGFATHQLFNNPDSYNDYSEVTLDFSYEELAEIRLSEIPNLNNKADHISLVTHTMANARIREIFDRVRYEACHNEMSKTKRRAILALLLSADESGIILHTILHNLDERLLRLEKILREEGCTDLSAEALAEKMGVSQTALARLCAAKFGAAPRDLLLKIRLDKARLALQLSDSPVTDIATACGFKDCSYFTKVFKRYFSVTPRQYRLNAIHNLT